MSSGKWRPFCLGLSVLKGPWKLWSPSTFGLICSNEPLVVYIDGLLQKRRMMTSSNGNIFGVTGHLCGEFTGLRWIHCTRPVTRNFDVFFDLRLDKRLRINNCEAGDLWRRRAHYGVTVMRNSAPLELAHWGRMTHICVGKLTIYSSYNGLSPGRRQAIIWTNAGILLIVSFGMNFGEI